MAWYTARWGSLFVVTYLLARQSEVPLVIQAAGSLLFLPLLAGGFVGGLLTARGDCWRLLRATLAGLCLTGAVMTAVALAGTAPLWALFAYLLLVGLGQLVNMTVHREALFQLVGARHASHSLVVDALQMSSSMALGPLVAGVLIQLGGSVAAFAGLFALHAVGLLGYRRVRPLAPSVRVPTSKLTEQWRVSRRLLGSSRSLRLALAITITMNSLVYGYISLVPLLLGRFHTSALTTSLLASGDGLGQMCAGLVFTTLGLRRHGLVLVIGAMTTCTGILVFSQAPVPLVAFGALVIAGTGTSGYAATQTVAALKNAAPAERGAVLGLMTTAIGFTPVGMLLIGGLAAALPASTALLLTTSIALIVVAGLALNGRDTLRAR